MTEHAMTPATHKAWNASERKLYANCAVRVLGEVDYTNRILVEFMSGPLEGERRWFTEAELMRQEPIGQEAKS